MMTENNEELKEMYYSKILYKQKINFFYFS